MNAPRPRTQRMPEPSRARVLRVETESRLVVVRDGPLAWTDTAALARQSELPAPAKLALGPDGGPELRAEVLRDRGVDAPKRARGAIDSARLWLNAGRSDVAGPGPEGLEAAETLDPEALLAGLGELPRAWAWEPRDEGGFHVHATAFGASVRLVVEEAGGAVRAIVRSALPAPGERSAAALANFALDANRRLRLARIGLGARPGDALPVSWDAVASPGAPLERAVPAMVEAVVFAHAATRLSLRALCQEAVAQTYLDTWSESRAEPDGMLARDGFQPA